MKLTEKLEKLQYFYWSIIPHRWRPFEVWYRFKCWAWSRYSTVKPRYLPHTWVDRTELLPHMMFEILSDFIEKECGPDCFVEWYGDDPHMIEVNGEQVIVRDELQDLYDWWHDDYMKNKDNIFDAWHEHRKLHVEDVWTTVIDQDIKDWVEELGEDSEDLEEFDTKYSSEEAKIENERLFKEAQELEESYRVGLEQRLIRLIKVRPYMWT